ncbi:Zinc finger protein 787 [Galemys pyrenaicus]|uniref:Zinc finger protein 787 n=1 Tax=Galemys pyrenaicus TaxID=202257 RepID=A0A8J6DJ71_GALPY|nr:Zinc finger protein 787 [Galemys pyrenaicus]
MELREEAWSPGPLDSEDQQMASHENPGEAAQGSGSHTDTALHPAAWSACPLPSPLCWAGAAVLAEG